MFIHSQVDGRFEGFFFFQCLGITNKAAVNIYVQKKNVPDNVYYAEYAFAFIIPYALAKLSILELRLCYAQ